MTAITKDTVIGDILNEAPETAPIFTSIGMHCLGCAMSSGETVGEACEVHGVETDEFIAALNERLGVKA
jgi:hybrid cluster-associated redox disulfide protein